MQVSKSNKLANVCYDIRGPVLKHAKRLEEEGHRKQRWEELGCSLLVVQQSTCSTTLFSTVSLFSNREEQS